MRDSRTRLAISALLIIIFALILAIIGLAEREPPPAPMPDLDPIRTEAVQTHIAELTHLAPTASPAVRTATATATTTTAPTSLSGTPSCMGLRFVRDVTIPDNTGMTPAEVFTKTWLVENTGTCAWEPGFQVVLIGGLAMGGSPFGVAQRVGPGGTIQVSIKMAAPTNETGVVQGTWMMSDLNGERFGDYLSVVIVVSGPTRSGSGTAVTATP